jgi:cyclohexanecarboxyl-CoA dehydrogenase
VDFDPDGDQQAIRETVRRFARERVAPGYLERAKSPRFPWALHRQVADLGVLGVLAEDELNPLGRPDFVAAGLVVEELAYADPNLANAAIIAMFTGALLAAHATAAVREQMLARLVAGETFVALGVTEPGSGSDAGAMRTTAVADGEGYTISGEKTSVTMLGESEAIIALARTVSAGEPRGISAFLVPLDAPGVHRAPMPDTGWQPLGRGILGLGDVRVGAEALLGAEGAAFRTVLNGFDYTRPLLALTGIGCAQAAVEETARYATAREAFGSAIARFEGVSFPLAEHATHLHAARLLCYEALARRGREQPHTAPAAMAKWFGPLAAGRAIHDCLLLHGNAGYTKELPFEQRLRDVLAVELADGTAQIQKIVIARELFGAQFVPYAR